MSKDIYRRLCAADNSLPIFSRDWWLDAVCGDSWQVLLEMRNGRVDAAMPIYSPCRRIISMPHYTQTMGIWFAPRSRDMKYTSLLEHRQAICKRFIVQLKNCRVFIQYFSQEFTDWLPFYWARYAQTTRYSYVLYGLRDSARLMASMSHQTRRNIKKAESTPVTVRRGVAVEDFLHIQALTFRRQNLKNRQSPVAFRRLVEAARLRGQGDIFGGYDEQGRLHAAAFIVWQRSSAYYIAGGGDPGLRDSGAQSLVLWKAIEYVSQYTDVFDFEGSMIPGVERFFREFGAVQRPYFMITRGKLNLIDRICMKLKRQRDLRIKK